MLIGSASRYIAGRSAVQTVYWRTTSDEQGAKMFKYGRVLKFAKESAESRPSQPPARYQKDFMSNSNQKIREQKV
ncbi:hypothetical protein C0J52_04360 [Blattella germanica]|nr:hypothetical protein C0J52_04360 [Blattella germanica]